MVGPIYKYNNHYVISNYTVNEKGLRGTKNLKRITLSVMDKVKVLIVGPKKSGKSGIANYLADPASFGSKNTNTTYIPTVSTTAMGAPLFCLPRRCVVAFLVSCSLSPFVFRLSQMTS